MYELDVTSKGAFYRTWPRLAAQGSSGAVTALGLTLARRPSSIVAAGKAHDKTHGGRR
jgi:hypothetical protein